MPAILPKEAVREAELAVQQAQEARRFHRKRSERGNEQRTADLELAYDRVHKAMKPLRSAIGKFPYGPQTEIAAQNRQIIRDASAALQKERRKLWKMLQLPKDENQ